MNTAVIYNYQDHIAEVILNRPAKKNALNHDLFTGLVEAGKRIKTNSNVRVVVIYGQDDCFCAGLDMEMFGSIDDLVARTHGIANLYQQAAWVWHEVPVPVIAAVRGYCFGGGLQIACGADMRYVHPDTKMSIMEIKWGLVPDMAGTQLWKDFVKQDLLRELSYTGEIFDGTRALQYGFCTRLSDDPVALAMETARKIADLNPDAIRANKRLINKQARLSPEEGLIAESLEQNQIFRGPNQSEAVRAQLEKRTPAFRD